MSISSEYRCRFLGFDRRHYASCAPCRGALNFSLPIYPARHGMSVPLNTGPRISVLGHNRCDEISNQTHFILHQEFQACQCPLAEDIPRPWASDGEVCDQAAVCLHYSPC